MFTGKEKAGLLFHLMLCCPFVLFLLIPRVLLFCQTEAQFTASNPYSFSTLCRSLYQSDVCFISRSVSGFVELLSSQLHVLLDFEYFRFPNPNLKCPSVLLCHSCFIEHLPYSSLGTNWRL